MRVRISPLRLEHKEQSLAVIFREIRAAVEDAHELRDLDGRVPDSERETGGQWREKNAHIAACTLKRDPADPRHDALRVDLGHRGNGEKLTGERVTSEPHGPKDRGRNLVCPDFEQASVCPCMVLEPPA